MRNSLANRLNIRDKAAPRQIKKRLRIQHIPLDSSDYAIEDLIKEISGNTTYQKIYDTKDARGVILELAVPEQMQAVVDKYNDTEFNGGKINVEIFEVEQRKGRNKKFNKVTGDRGARGSHYNNNNSNNNNNNNNSKYRSRDRARDERVTAEQLDAELDAYLKKDD